MTGVQTCALPISDLDPAGAQRAALQFAVGRRGHDSVFVVSSTAEQGFDALWAAFEAAPRRERIAARETAREALQPGDRPFRILGVQQIAIGSEDKSRLRRLWVDLLGLELVGHAAIPRENVDEDILRVGRGAHAVEIDLMQPIEPGAKPAVHLPPLNHVGLWVDDLPAAMHWLEQKGMRFAPGGIRNGAGGHPVCFIHPRADDGFEFCGEGVLIELVQAPEAVIAALRE